MLEIDGTIHSGSGTLLRFSVALATLTNTPLHFTNIRKQRPKPGLRAQHLQAVLACSKMSHGKIEGASIGSTEIFYEPGKRIHGGNYVFDVGTAGSAVMIALILSPLTIFAAKPCKITIIGGLFQDFAPSFYHFRNVYIPVLRKMGANINATMVKPGYVPEGKGKLILEADPIREPLNGLELMGPLESYTIKGISLSSKLERSSVSERMAEHARELILSRGIDSEIQVLRDKSAAHQGAALALWLDTIDAIAIGADQAGKPGRRSEIIATNVVKNLFQDIDSGATVDRHLADQIILAAGLASGTTQYTVPKMNDHIESNLYIIDKFLQANVTLEKKKISIHGAGFQKQ